MYFVFMKNECRCELIDYRMNTEFPALVSAKIYHQIRIKMCSSWNWQFFINAANKMLSASLR